MSKHKFSGFFILTVTAVLFSLPTLWLVQNTVRYSFFLAELGAIFLLGLSFYDDYFVTLRFRNLSRKYLDFVLLAFSIILLVLNFSKTYLVMNVIAVFVVPSFLPGYFILRITRTRFPHPYVETIVFSFVLSLPVTVILSAALRSIPEKMAILSIVYTVLSFFLAFRSKFNKEGRVVESSREFGKCRFTNTLLFLSLLGFLSFSCLRSIHKWHMLLGLIS